MRKKSLLKIIDTVLWLLIALIPVFAYLLQYVSGSDAIIIVTSFNDFMFDNFLFTDSNCLFTFFTSLFDGQYFLSLNGGMYNFLTWFTTAELCHLAVDFIMFLPRFLMGVLDKYAF